MVSATPSGKDSRRVLVSITSLCTLWEVGGPTIRSSTTNSKPQGRPITNRTGISVRPSGGVPRATSTGTKDPNVERKRRYSVTPEGPVKRLS